MDKFHDDLLFAEAARQCGNLDLAVRILIEAIGGEMRPIEEQLRIEEAARKIARLRDFMRGSGLSGRGADRVVDGITEAIFDAVEGCKFGEHPGGTIRGIARACGAAVPGKNEDYRDYEEEENHE